MARKTSNPKELTLGVRLSAADNEALSVLASKMDRPKSEVVRALIRRAASTVQARPTLKERRQGRR